MSEIVIPDDIKVLSIRQPWAWLIVNGHKNIENRSWLTHYRGPVLIHAGIRTENYLEVRDHVRFLIPIDIHEGVLSQMPERRELHTGGIVGIATITDCVMESDSPWFGGRYGYVLQDARPLPFVPMKGQLGIFNPPPGVLAEIRKAMKNE